LTPEGVHATLSSIVRKQPQQGEAMKRLLFVSFILLSATPAQADSSSFTRLMAEGRSVECSFQKFDASQKGTIYIDGGQMRMDSMVNDRGTEKSMHMIRRDEKMYTWGESMEGRGIIMSASMGEAGGPMGGMTQGQNMDEEMDFTCQPWSRDESKFEVPSDVEFMDFAQMMAGQY
jgi:hypothetical protein